ncbi:MAG: hypothetical protein K2I07_00340 [Lachnospiraceae bacterium]|nr:hypothetical protein [Lachnospiraceae bacterium]
MRSANSQADISPKNIPSLPMYFVNTIAHRRRMINCAKLDSIGTTA